MTGVGGSSLYTVASGKARPSGLPGQPLDEAVWNDGTPGGSTDATGGGVSQRLGDAGLSVGSGRRGSGWSTPTPAVPPARRPRPVSTSCREEPDVSASADPYPGYAVYVTNSSGSALDGDRRHERRRSPLWAALMALTNAQPSCRGKTIGFANPSLYALAGSNYGAYFHDVTLANPRTGLANNDALGTNGGLYPVTAGYDMTTGLGTRSAPLWPAAVCPACPGVHGHLRRGQPALATRSPR